MCVPTVSASCSMELSLGLLRGKPGANFAPAGYLIPVAAWQCKQTLTTNTTDEEVPTVVTKVGDLKMPNRLKETIKRLVDAAMRAGEAVPWTVFLLRTREPTAAERKHAATLEPLARKVLARKQRPEEGRVHET